jgi:hypothetical protein
VTPYPGKEQVSSGTLAYALGAGKAVVATPYWYAEELLSDGRGRLVPFNDPVAMARAINALLSDDVKRNAARKKGYQFCRDMVWREVGGEYLRLAGEVIEERARSPRPRSGKAGAHPMTSTLPEPDFSHVRRLTDDTGILHRATLTIPDRAGGYALASNAMALGVTSLQHAHGKKQGLERLAGTYAAFISHALDRDAAVLRGGMTYDRSWQEEPASEDAIGKTLWGLGVAVAHPPTKPVRALCTRLFLEVLPLGESLASALAKSFAIVGIQAFLEEFGGNTEARRVRALLAEQMLDDFPDEGQTDWPWPEDPLPPGGAKIAEALILAGTWIPDEEMKAAGLRSLAWLAEAQISASALSPVGSEGWARGGEKPTFDQSPADVAHFVEACTVAHYATAEKRWLDAARLGYQWFLGANVFNEPLADFASGGCREALTPLGPNENQGAEASLAWLICLLHMHMIFGVEGQVAEGDEAGPAGG